MRRPVVMLPVAAVLLALVVGGCAGLPGSSPVVRADDVAAGAEVVTYEPAPPAEGASPEEIVAGFLDAMLAYPVSTATASEYLAPDAAEGWASSEGVRIYRAPDIGLVASDDSSARVALSVEQTGALDATGRYHPAGGSATLELDLVQVDGQWRIAAPPPGMLVSQTYFDTYYEPYDVYSFDLRGERLLADPVHVPVGDQAPTALMASLAAGPPPTLAGEARTYLPPREEGQPVVTLGPDGVAEIELDTDVNALALEVRRRLSAQVVRTLGQLPGVDAVRIVGLDGPLVVGGTSVQPTTAWRRFDPSAPEGRPGAVVDGRVVTLAEGEVTPVPGLPDDIAADVVRVAVAQRAVATVGSTGLLRVVLDDGVELRDTVESLVGLGWDPAGQLWVADLPGGLLRVRVVTADGTRTVDTAGVDGQDVTSFAVDGSGRRYALVRAGGGTVVGGIDAGGAVPALRPGSAVAPDVAAPVAVVWTGPTEVAVVGTDGSGSQVHRALIDGSPSGVPGSTPLLPDLVVDGIAVGPGADPALYVTDVRRRLWFLRPGSAWRVLDVAAAALSSGR